VEIEAFRYEAKVCCGSDGHGTEASKLIGSRYCGHSLSFAEAIPWDSLVVDSFSVTYGIAMAKQWLVIRCKKREASTILTGPEGQGKPILRSRECRENLDFIGRSRRTKSERRKRRRTETYKLKRTEKT
jgi:hypothetical protein